MSDIVDRSDGEDATPTSSERRSYEAGEAQSVEQRDIASLLERCRNQQGRQAALSDFVAALTPDGIDPTLWQTWLRSGGSPFKQPRSTRLPSQSQSSGRSLERQSKTVDRAAKDVEAAKRHLDAVQAKVDVAEAALADARRHDIAIMHHAVETSLREQIEPLFAMGPAWAVMRVLSGFVSAEEVADELHFERKQERRDAREQALRRRRKEDTDLIKTELDYWVGDFMFEVAVRDALLDVINKFKERSRAG